jgi:hypothetical protein
VRKLKEIAGLRARAADYLYGPAGRLTERSRRSLWPRGANPKMPDFHFHLSFLPSFRCDVYNMGVKCAEKSPVRITGLNSFYFANGPLSPRCYKGPDERRERMEMGTKRVWVRGNARLAGKSCSRRRIFGKLRLNSAKSGQIGVKKNRKPNALPRVSLVAPKPDGSGPAEFNLWDSRGAMLRAPLSPLPLFAPGESAFIRPATAGSAVKNLGRTRLAGTLASPWIANRELENLPAGRRRSRRLQQD